jgi:hypothetical protein
VSEERKRVSDNTEVDGLPEPNRGPRRFGIAATIVWIVAVVTYFAFRWDGIAALKPNEMGDFLAGVFAPLAFLWVIVAFLQQSSELRLQVRELSVQVRATREMASAARAQAHRDIAEAQAFFVTEFGTGHPNAYTISLRNEQSKIADVSIGETIGNIEIKNNPTVEILDTRQSIKLRFVQGKEGWFEIRYRDMHQKRQSLWLYYNGTTRIKCRAFGQGPISDKEELARWLDTA